MQELIDIYFTLSGKIRAYTDFHNRLKVDDRMPDFLKTKWWEIFNESFAFADFCKKYPTVNKLDWFAQTVLKTVISVNRDTTFVDDENVRELNQLLNHLNDWSGWVGEVLEDL